MSSVWASTSSTTRSGTKRENRSRTRWRSTASQTTSTARTAVALAASATSGATTGVIQPALNARYAPAANSPPATRSARKPRSGGSHRPTRTGIDPRPMTSSHPIQRGAAWSGKSRKTVEIVSAWISGPLIICSPEVEVAATSCSDGATAPTTTILSRNADAGTRPSSTDENEYCSNVPGGPWKSIHARLSSNPASVRRRPVAISDATTPNARRPSTSNGIWRMTPLASAGITALPARAPSSRSRSSPPSTRVPPLPSVSVVARTIRFRARSTASTSMMSSRSELDGSVNWMS